MSCRMCGLSSDRMIDIGNFRYYCEFCLNIYFNELNVKRAKIKAGLEELVSDHLDYLNRVGLGWAVPSVLDRLTEMILDVIKD